MTDFEVTVTESDIREYDAEAQARREKYARVARRSSPVRFDWVSPELNPNGSLADSELEASEKKIADQKGSPVKQQWAGTQRGNSGSGTAKKGWS